MNVDPATLDAQAVAVYAAQAGRSRGIIAFPMDVIPRVIGVCQRQHSAGLTVCGVVWFCAAPFGQQKAKHYFQCD